MGFLDRLVGNKPEKTEKHEKKAEEVKPVKPAKAEEKPAAAAEPAPVKKDLEIAVVTDETKKYVKNFCMMF